MEKFLASFHVEDIFVTSPLTAVEIGFLAWALLALSMAAIFVDCKQSLQEEEIVVAYIVLLLLEKNLGGFSFLLAIH